MAIVGNEKGPLMLEHQIGPLVGVSYKSTHPFYKKKIKKMQQF